MYQSDNRICRIRNGSMPQRIMWCSEIALGSLPHFFVTQPFTLILEAAAIRMTDTYKFRRLPAISQ